MAERLTRSTAHILRPLPVLALVAALMRLQWRRAEQMRLKLEGGR